MQELGYNYRLSGYSSCPWYISTEKSSSGYRKKKKNCKKIYTFIKEFKWDFKNTPQQIEGHAFHLFVI